MKAKIILFVLLQSLILLIQLLTLTTTYWNTWELKFNWTQAVGRFSVRPSSDENQLRKRTTAVLKTNSWTVSIIPGGTARLGLSPKEKEKTSLNFHKFWRDISPLDEIQGRDGQLVSRGHSGLWSRCLTVYRRAKHVNVTTLLVDKCFSNFDDLSSSEGYSYGKMCKIATSGLCVALAAITAATLIITIASTVRKKHNFLLSSLLLLFILLQGSVSVAIPLLYISGNMDELVHQLTAAYGLLLVVHVYALYHHGWSFWLQVSLSFVWITSTAVYSLNNVKSDHRWRSSNSPRSTSINGRTVEQIDSESEALRAT